MRSLSNKLVCAALVLLLAAAAHAAGNPHGNGNGNGNGHDNQHGQTHVDTRYNHNQSYPVRGYYAPSLPQGYYTAHYHGSPYYYNGGAWYRPYGPRFVVVAPPIGIGVQFLPPFYTTVWFGGMPYYYADDTYYMYRPERRQYVVTQPPTGQAQVGAEPSGPQEPFVYPKNGQSEQQQSTDRYECHRWAADQTGFDPTQPLGNVPESQVSEKRADYRRAEGACLEARGYSVK
jgi:hypothetical protein